MFAFLRNWFHSSDDLETRQKQAHAQDKKVREGLSERQIDKGVQDSMAASDSVAKY